MPVVGWDIGGVNTKVARVVDGAVVDAHAHPFEIQRDPLALGPLLVTLAARVSSQPDDNHAVTMTAELSQMFRTKRDGVAFVLDAVSTAFPAGRIHVYSVDGRFLTPGDARHETLAVAASNWAATARMVAADHPDAILIDVGTTTTDIIPIVNGTVVALGTTDPTRLASGELVYSGAVRTAVEAIVRDVPFGDGNARVSAEAFALIGDVHVWRGDLAPDDYSVPAPDGRPPSRDFAGERMARIICADREMLDSRGITRIADAIALAQTHQIADAITTVRARHPSLSTAVVTGVGAFIAERAARSVGLDVVRLAESIGAESARSAPAAAVALLLDRELAGQQTAARSSTITPRTDTPAPNVSAGVDVVIKIGGGLLGHDRLLDDALQCALEHAQDARVAIVPGGGPFADAVRAADARLTLDDDTAHWMAVLAMDQYAHLLASRDTRLTVAETAASVHAALGAGLVPVIAPYRWLRDVDPLPHSWDVTSDSISAWFAGTLGATHLVLVKPPGARGLNLTDAHFAVAIPPSVAWTSVAGDDLEMLGTLLRAPVSRR